MAFDLNSTLANISKIKDAVKQFLPAGQQTSIFNQLDSLSSALQQNKEDLQSDDKFRNRAHAAFTWSIEWIVIYNYFLRDVFVNVVQLFGHHIAVTPVDNTTIVTLVSLALFGKTIFSGFDLVDRIKQKVEQKVSEVKEDVTNTPAS